MAHKTGGLLDNLSKIQEKAEGGTFDRTTDSNEAIREKLDTLPTSLPLYTTNGVIVEDGATGTPNTTDLVSDATENTFGSWTQMDASVSDDSYITSITVAKLSDNANYKLTVEIGTGIALSEATKIRFSTYHDVASDVGYVVPMIYVLPVPVKVASGTRIAGRISTNSSGAKTVVASIQYYQSL